MKIKNLLLASLAVAAMTACSNEEEFIDNGIQAPTGEEATMRVNFTSVTGKSRAVKEDGKSNGSDEESKITTATIVLDYGGNKLIVKDNLTVESTGTNGEKLVSTPAFNVAAGTGVTIYAFVNPSTDLNDKINAAKNAENFKALEIGAQTLPATGLDYLASSIAEENKFLMSGSKEGITIIAGKDDNKETINVDRVSAKLDEQTKATDAFTVSAPTYTIKGDKNWLVVKFIGHSFPPKRNHRIVLYLPKGKLLTAKGGKSSASNQNLLKRHEHDLFQWGIHLCRSGNYCKINLSALN